MSGRAPASHSAGDPGHPRVHLAGMGADVDAQGAHRAYVDVDGAPLWFTSPDAPLRPSGEAFATAVFLSALLRGARLVVEAPVAETWMRGVPRVLDVARAWWGSPALVPEAPIRDDKAEQPRRRVGLCFSGGLDSFHALLAGGPPIDDLIFLHGFDIELDDAARYETYLAAVREIAAATGTQVVSIRTNVRAVPPISRAPWDYAHGGALSAAGHLLSDRIGTLVMGSSIPYVEDAPWGSHWRVDPHWSTARLHVLQVGPHLRRVHKLGALAHHPLVRRYLRVCWEHRSAEMNCGVCEKCVRTQLVLAKLGQLEHFTCFGGAGSLAERIDALPYAPDVVISNYTDHAEYVLPDDVRRAVVRLIARSATHNRRPPAWRRWLQPAVRTARAALRIATPRARS